MLGHPVQQPLMDGLDHLHRAGVPQPLPQGGLEGLLLLGGGHGGLGVEDGVDELLMDLIRLFGVEQGVVQIGGPAVKGGEQEAQLRRGHHLAGPAVELVLPGEVAQLHLAVLHRADAADQIGEHRVRVLLKPVVLPTAGHVVGVVSQQDQIVPVQLQGVDDFAVEGLPGLGVLQLGVPQGGEELVLLAVRHLLGGKDDVNELLAQGAGQGFLQKS